MVRAHVLIVDDEPAITQTLKMALELEGYAVDTAATAGEARAMLGQGHPDLLLLDVALPDGDGVTLLEGLRGAGGAGSEIATVMMSGHGTIEVALEATRLGALDFLEKPISSDRLLLVVDNIVRRLDAERRARQLEAEAGYLEELLGDSHVMVQLREHVARAARSTASVLVQGERGTGKELVARAIHRASPRASAVMEKLNCAAVPAELIESELFGHEAGAFTGATRRRQGKFERASGGTLFLDEVGDMPAPMQAKLLRVLQEGEIERVGGNATLRVDVRVVAATNRDLPAACETGAFRADLYDRLNVLPIHLPPLRARRDDIPLLAHHFVARAALANGRQVRLQDSALVRLAQHSYPGNVRELGNLIERLVILSPDDAIEADDVQRALGMGSSPGRQGLYRPSTPFKVLAEEAERTILEEAVAAHGGQMAATARALGLERSHLYKKLKALGLRSGGGAGGADGGDE